MSAGSATAIKMPGLHSVPSFVDKDDVAKMQTLLITPDKVDEWKMPGVQRPLSLNAKVRGAAEAMQLEAAKDPEEACATIDGVITLGKLGKDTYLIDGQHRIRGAFAWAARELLIAGGVLVKQALVDVRERHFDTMAEMAEAFINLNSQLNPTKPDDIMRSLAHTSPFLRQIEEVCPFIGYDMTGANKKTKMLSMSSAVRTWFGSGGLVPATGPSALEIVKKYLDANQASAMKDFYLAMSEAGWVNDAFRRLWGSLNLGINMWLWRRTVLGEIMRFGSGGHKPMVLTREQYIVSARTLMNPEYLDWLGGKQLRYQDRVPCYNHIKDYFTPALASLGIESPRFPMPQWT